MGPHLGHPSLGREGGGWRFQSSPVPRSRRGQSAAAPALGYHRVRWGKGTARSPLHCRIRTIPPRPGRCKEGPVTSKTFLTDPRRGGGPASDRTPSRKARVTRHMGPGPGGGHGPGHHRFRHHRRPAPPPNRPLGGGTPRSDPRAEIRATPFVHTAGGGKIIWHFLEENSQEILVQIFLGLILVLRPLWGCVAARPSGGTTRYWKFPGYL